MYEFALVCSSWCHTALILIHIYIYIYISYLYECVACIYISVSTFVHLYKRKTGIRGKADKGKPSWFFFVCWSESDRERLVLCVEDQPLGGQTMRLGYRKFKRFVVQTADRSASDSSAALRLRKQK